MRGRTGKDFFTKDDNDDNNLNLHQNNDQFSLNKISNINPLPCYDLSKQAFPAYSFPKDERF